MKISGMGMVTLAIIALVLLPIAECRAPVGEEVTFQNGDVTLAGTLSLPPGSGPHSAVILLSGSGPNDRDFYLSQMIVDDFNGNDIAALRYDDRGVDGSTGEYLESTIEDMAGDVLAAVELLQNHPNINPEQIGILGHSYGGTLAIFVASRSDDVAFIIAMAAPSLDGGTAKVEQLTFQMQAGGVPEAEIEQQREVLTIVMDVVGEGGGLDEILVELRRAVEELPEGERAQRGITDIDQYVNSIGETLQQQFPPITPFVSAIIAYDPAPVLEELTIPILALYGELDHQVPAEVNSEAMIRIQNNSGNENFVVEVIPKANHLFQEAVTGGRSEWETLKKELAPGLLDRITEWVLQYVDIVQ
jgi:pimeloyl-ACP methyl ester carboxylesterase